ncbi:MAG TPA: pyruvate, phosphate dikinase, partial [Terricaulis sp.]|nr:pyruvate, phosphate dikinase [Terricaulis sp.]
QDFVDIFKAMGARPVTIRFLDPPLHEFLPHTEEDCADVAKATGLDARALLARAKELSESNPMLGFRGCRLAIVYPEIYDMQARAVFEAACDMAEQGAAPIPEIMIPFVITKKELETLKARVDAVAAEVFAKRGRKVEYLVGTMIELPRAALRAGEIAEAADFFSFGTNDLTQTTMGLSRDDAGKFLGAYVEKGMLASDPFVTVDADGVGELVKLASERGRAARAGLKLGVCGEHGGDPASVAFFETAGLDYVSCSPYRVPIARLAAAQAALKG